MDEIPKISDETDLLLAAAKDEYRWLTEYPRPQFGFANWVELKIESRLTFLRQVITNYICFDNESEEQNGKSS